MNDRPIIILGLAIFLMIVTTPIWLNAVSGTDAKGPEIIIQTKDTPGKDECILAPGEMAAQHMDMLNVWRDEVVRDHQRVYKTGDGRAYSKSLTKTCLDCHSNKDKFCDSCHDYMGVKPYCWACHLEPKDLR